MQIATKFYRLTDKRYVPANLSPLAEMELTKLSHFDSFDENLDFGTVYVYGLCENG